MKLDSDSSGLDWPLSSFVWDFVAFNFDPFTLSPPLPITLSAAFDQTHAALAYPAVTLNSHLRIDPLFPMTSDLSGSSLQPSGRPPPPPGPYLRCSRWITRCSGHLRDYLLCCLNRGSTAELFCHYVSIKPRTGWPYIAPKHFKVTLVTLDGV